MTRTKKNGNNKKNNTLAPKDARGKYYLTEEQVIQVEALAAAMPLHFIADYFGQWG